MDFKGRKLAKEKGITLVALVVTIIVLLILAGVTIQAVIGQNGIIEKAKNTEEAHAIAKIKEELELAIHALEVDYHIGNYQGTFRDYIFSNEGQQKLSAELGVSNISFNPSNYIITYKGIDFKVSANGTVTRIGEGDEQGGIDWEEIMSTAQKHPDQSADNEDIGIDANGNIVNLDLWLYEYVEDGYNAIMLGDANSCENGNICYLPFGDEGGSYPDNVEKEHIVCPKYIKLEGENEFLPVVILGNNSFQGASEMLSIVIPDTVMKIGYNVFTGCSSIQSLTIPNSVVEIGQAFVSGCTSLTNIQMPSFTGDSISGAFIGCSRLCPHEWNGDNGYCEICQEDCDHENWVNGVCSTCGYICYHEWMDGVCTICRTHCPHDWDNYGNCQICRMDCEHPSWTNGICNTCGVECDHYYLWNNGVCEKCGIHCSHEWNNEGYCNICKMFCEHPSWTNGICNTCGVECEHYYYWNNGVCENCGIHCSHEWGNYEYCNICGIKCDHPSKTDGICDVCGYDTINGSN